MKSLKSRSNCPHRKNPGYRMFLCWTNILITIMIIMFNDRVKSLYFLSIISIFTQLYDTVTIIFSFYSQGNWGLENLGTLPMFSLVNSRGRFQFRSDWFTRLCLRNTDIYRYTYTFYSLYSLNIILYLIINCCAPLYQIF